MTKEVVTIGNSTIELETGSIARQAHGSILLREGKTVILSTAVYDPVVDGPEKLVGGIRTSS